jgi:carbon monoxide dehydrogenase subunit G
MEMQGSRQLAINQQQTWDALNDPQVLKLCIPGCDKIEASGENQYSMAVSLKIGPLAAKFAGKIALSDINAPHSYTIAFEGQGGPAGFGKGNAKVQLHPNADGVALEYTVQASVGGKIAQVGQRLIDGVAKSMAEDFFKRFDQEMQKRYPEAYAERPAAAAPAAQGSTTARVPTWVWVAAAAVGVVAYLVVR